MLQYLMNFGIEPKEDIEKVDEMLNIELDINDRTILQEQFNNSRRAQLKLLKINDELQAELLAQKSKLAKLTRELYINNDSRSDITKAMQTDLEIIAVNETIEALQMSLKTVSNHLDLVKSDVRMLNSSMYNRNSF